MGGVLVVLESVILPRKEPLKEFSDMESHYLSLRIGSGWPEGRCS